MVQTLQAYKRETEQTVKHLSNTFTRLDEQTHEAVKVSGWSAIVSGLVVLDRGMSIPEWQDIGCVVQFEASDQIIVVSIGCSMIRDYAYSTLHYEISSESGEVVVPRGPSRLANNSYGVVSASQTSVGRLFAHTLPKGRYNARLWVRTVHANSTDWAATLTVHSASIAVRNY